MQSGLGFYGVAASNIADPWSRSELSSKKCHMDKIWYDVLTTMARAKEKKCQRIALEAIKGIHAALCLAKDTKKREER